MPTIDDIKPRGQHVQGIILITFSVTAWGSGGLFTRLLPFDMWTIVFWRGAFGGAFIGLFVLWRYGRSGADIILSIGAVGVLAVLCLTCTITVMVPAIQHTSVANAMTILATVPFFTAAVSWIWLRESPSVLTLVASVVVIVGVVIMVGPSAGGPKFGDWLAVMATATQAVMTVAIRRNQHVEMVPVAMLSAMLSSLIALPLAAHLFDLNVRDYAVAAGFGMVPMTLGMMLYVIGSAMIPATLTALISTIEAPIGTIWAWIGVGEKPATTTLIGGGIVLSAVIGRLLVEKYFEERNVARDNPI